MADSKITALTALAENPADGDQLVVVDVSDTTMAASGTTKKLAASYVVFASKTQTLSGKTFSDGIIGPTWKPASDSTTAIQIQTSAAGSFVTFDTTNRRAYIGDGNTPAAALLSTDALTLSGTSASIGASIVVASATAGNRGLFKGVRARGTLASPTTTSSGDSVLSILGGAYDGTTVQNTAVIEMIVDGAVSSGVAPQRIAFITGATNSASRDERMAIKNDGKTHIGLGAGGSPTALLHLGATTTSRASFCINSGTAPTSPVAGDIWNDGALTFYNANATTNAVVDHLRLRRNSTGTAAAGFGLGIVAELESSTTDGQTAGRLTWAWSTATHASRAAIGKLTAYYTSTEREAITWTATSSGVQIGVNTAAPGRTLDVNGTIKISGSDALFTTSSWAKFIEFNNGASFTWLKNGGTYAHGFGGTIGGFYWFRSTADDNSAAPIYDMILTDAGRLGVGTLSPQSIFHVHDGTGGFMFVNQASVDGTLVTVIPDTTGDVTERIHIIGWVSNSSAGFVSQVSATYLDVSSSTTKTDGVNTLTIAVTAAGAFTLQATAGAATWKVCLWVFWR